MVKVKVINNSTGKPVSKILVAIDKDGIFPSVYKSDRTNRDGEVNFNLELPCRGKILLEGKEVYNGKIQAFQEIYQ